MESTVPLPDRDHFLKLRWANLHLNALEDAVKGFIESKPHETVTEFDPETGEHVVRLYRRPVTPPGISLILGDLLFNLRSGLDQLVYALAKHASPACTGEKTEFPIYTTPEEFARWRKQKIGDLAPEAQTAIENVQPYKTDKTGTNPHRTLLCALHDLSRIDKHRLLHVVTPVGHLSDLAWEAPDGGVISVVAAKAPPGGFVEGAEIGRYRVSMPGQPNVRMNFRLHSDVCFGSGSVFPQARGESVLGLMKAIYRRVGRTMTDFEVFFGKH
jgi:hypothetical protein